MNGRLQGFLELLDLLAEGQRRQAELVIEGGFRPRAGLTPVRVGNGVALGSTPVERYSTARNTSVAAVIVAALAGIVSNTLALDQRAIFERDVQRAASVATLPEVVVSASRLEQ